jgi:hypothetical protein
LNITSLKWRIQSVKWSTLCYMTHNGMATYLLLSSERKGKDDDLRGCSA